MMHDMNDSWHWGFGWGHWGFGVLFWIIVILVVAALVKYLLNSRK